MSDLSADIINVGLTTLDSDGVRRPVLAVEAPSIDNGLWKLLPDGSMEILWQIKTGAHWHDGEPLTSLESIVVINLPSVDNPEGSKPVVVSSRKSS